MSAPAPTGGSLLVVIDPAARRIDGESVRIAKDVLSAGASTKICLPDGPEEIARALARRGSRRPVVVGDDHALMRAVGLLHRERSLSEAALALVPVGASAAAVALARSLGVPTGTVAAARAVLDGVERKLDLLVDDSDGVVLGGLRIPAVHPAPVGASRVRGAAWWASGLRTCRSLARSLAGPGAGAGSPGEAGRETGGGAPHRLRVEADGVLLADLDRPVAGVSVSTREPGEKGGDGFARIVVQPGDGGDGAPPVTARARAITVSGADFRYRADAMVGGPVRTRTWTVQPGAWRLTVPRG